MREFKSWIAALAAGTALVSAGVAGAEPATTIQFSPVKVPVTDADKRVVQATDSVTIGGKTYAIGFTTIARSGDKLGSGVWGQLVDAKGQPIKNEDGSEHISVDIDFSSLLPVGGKLFSVSHFESRPGAMYVTELKQDPATGKLGAVSTRNVDFSKFGGLWVPCAGTVTPWGTHLGSEEYPPDARGVEEATDYAKGIDDYFKPMVRYFGLNPWDKEMTVDQFRAAFNPYKYGYPVEVAVKADGSTDVAKHYAMGRSAIELAYVMPDKKTVYISDDGTNVGFYMFVADKAGDLSAGNLYALKWNQKSAENGGQADITWVPLGHASEAEIAKAINAGTKFADLFETAKGDDNGSCPTGFGAINTTDGFECLKVKPGQDSLASRLEVRRFAALKGASTEFRKEEGITFDADHGKLYVAMSEIERGMEDFKKGGKPSKSYDKGGPNDIRVEANSCGGVYGLDIGHDATIGSDYVAKTMSGVVLGIEKKYPEGSEYAGKNSCDVDAIANPDNLTYMTGHNTLIIGEDTGSGHQNDAVWAYDVNAKKLTRIETTPYGSETTSPYFYPNVNGFGYLASVVQHPYGESDQKQLKDAADARAYFGYIGPFPKTIVPTMN